MTNAGGRRLEHANRVACACLVLLLLTGCDPCANNPCNDGQSCNGVELCVADGGQVVCTPGLPVECAEGSFCSEPSGMCVDPCMDMSCDDGEVCTLDTCMATAADSAACMNTPIEGCCRSDTDCGENERCTENVCRFTADESNPCTTFQSIDAPNNMIEPGIQQIPLFTNDGSIQIGTVDLVFRDIKGADYSLGDVPVSNVGIGEGEVDVDLASIALLSKNTPAVSGVRVFPLFSESINSGRPLVLQGLDGGGMVLVSETFNSVPDNVGNQADPQSVDLMFDGAAVTRVRIIVPAVAFLTVQQICLTTAP